MGCGTPKKSGSGEPRSQQTKVSANSDLTPAREFKRRAEHALPGRAAKVVVYGEARRGSDWDIAIFLKGRVAASEATALSHIGSDLFFDRGWNIHPVTLPARREAEDSHFLRNVRRDGVAV